MLSVKNLHASVDGKEILRGIDLEVKAGEVHAIMGRSRTGRVWGCFWVFSIRSRFRASRWPTS